MEVLLDHAKHEAVANAAGNTRNGKSRKTLKGEIGELPIDIPRDRLGSIEPQLIPKYQPRGNGFDEKIRSLYARGMPVREIQAHLIEMDDADQGLEGCAIPVYYPVRRPDAAAVEKSRLHKIRDTLSFENAK